jgi:hypothetical protein
MLYFKTADGRRILVLDPLNVKRMLAGKPTLTSDKSVLVVYTPDIEFTFGQIKQLLPRPGDKVILPSELDAILEESLKRPPVMRTEKEEGRIRLFRPSLKGKRK